MDFEWAEEDRQFRSEIQALLSQELPSWYRGRYNENEEAFKVTLHVAGKMAEKGMLTRQWPKEYGGSDAPIWQQIEADWRKSLRILKDSPTISR